MTIYKLILYPLALLVHLAISIRHALFNLGILRSVSYDIPIISVGNLNLGGTGKTPHIEYLIRLLMSDFKIATLSRGYGRKTKAYLEAHTASSAAEIGDEPLQFINKFPEITVSVDANRKRGIENLLKNHPKLEVILLDDAFQHRYVKPGLSILLTDFHNLYKEDYLFPTGSLRDTSRSARRADVIIVTKTPKVLSPILKRSIHQILKPAPHQLLFYSYIKYGSLVSMHPDQDPPPKKLKKVILFSGIAEPYPLKDYLSKNCHELNSIDFRDHKRFTKKDLLKVKEKYLETLGSNKVIITTEKDAMRLKDSKLLSIFENLPLFYIPIEVKLHKDERASYDQLILDYVRTHQGKS